MSNRSALRLSEFIRRHMEPILQAWEDFAATIKPAALSMDHKALRDHASQMLLAIADDLDRTQTRNEEITKSEGRGKADAADTAAESHAIARLSSGYSIDQLASEYRALRSSVLRLWAAEWKEGLETNADDITRFNEAIDQALAESLARYSRLFNQSRNLFLAILGHDLRNPLSAAINGAQVLLLAQDLDARYRQIAIRIFNSGRRMNQLVDDLTDYTRTHLGAHLPIVTAPANIADIAQNIVDEIRTSYPERNIVFDPVGDFDGKWDKARIAQVVSNLLGNAIQHGATSETITVAMAAQGDDVLLTVNNQGQVIPEEKLHTIFEPMVRLVEPGATLPEGRNSLGLGLYIVREVVNAHAGAVDVRSLPGEGTTFTIRLPRTPPAMQNGSAVP